MMSSADRKLFLIVFRTKRWKLILLKNPEESTPSSIVSRPREKRIVFDFAVY